MLRDWLTSTKEPFSVEGLSHVPDFLEVNQNTFESRGYDSLLEDVNDAEKAILNAIGTMQHMAKLGSMSEDLAALSVNTINVVLYPTTIEVSMESLFKRSGNELVVSLEAFDNVKDNIVKFVKAAINAIINAGKKFFIEHLSAISRTQKATEKTLKYLKGVSVSEVAGREGYNFKVDEHKYLKHLVTFTDADDVAGPHPVYVKFELEKIRAKIDPAIYRTPLESLLQDLNSGNEDLDSVFEVNRLAIFGGICNFLDITDIEQSKGDKGGIITEGKSKVLWGGQTITVMADSDTAEAPSISLEEYTGSMEYSKVRSCNKDLAIGLMEASNEALSVLVDLKKEFLQGDKFKRKVDAVIAELSSLRKEGPDMELERILNELPGYVKLYDAPLKLKTEHVHNWVLGLIELIHLSSKHWK